MHYGVYCPLSSVHQLGHKMIVFDLCELNGMQAILATANTASRRRWPFCPRLHMHRMNTVVTRSTNSFWLPETYTNVCYIFLILKGSSFMNVLHNFKWPLYMAHHNLLVICHQLKIRHLYETFNFSTQCICIGTGSLFVCSFCCFRGKARPLWRKTVFAVVSIV